MNPAVQPSVPGVAAALPNVRVPPLRLILPNVMVSVPGAKPPIETVRSAGILSPFALLICNNVNVWAPGKLSPLKPIVNVLEAGA